MRKLLLLLCLLAAGSATAQTRAIVPRGDGEGSIGDASRAWGTGVFTRATIRGVDGHLMPTGATGVNQIATWNGTSWLAQAVGAPGSTPSVGTNIIKWDIVWGITNTWVAPSTQILFTAWGAGGAGFGSGAGHARAIWVGAAGTIFDIVVGTAGGAVATNNGPGAGRGINGASTNMYNGGGYTAVSISGTTNIILIAGGAGASGASSFAGGPGGGFWAGSLDGLTTAGTNVSAGGGAFALDEYGSGATAGTNVAATTTNLSHLGSYLQGGHASTNGCTAGITAVLGGGGGGYYGGAGATRTNATVGTTVNAGGGGGLSWANTNFVIFAQLFAGERTIGSGVPAGQDHPTYTSGRGVGGQNGYGANGCAGAMW